MAYLSIETISSSRPLKTILLTRARELACEGIQFNVVEQQIGSVTVFNCQMEEDFREMWPEDLILDLSSLIRKRFVEQEVKELLHNRYTFLKAWEQEKLKGQILKELGEEEDSVQDCLRQHLQESTTLILEGFIRFRLQAYGAMISQIVEKAVEQYLLEREYQEFIRLLRYFMDIQEPREDRLHVLIAGYEFELLDQEGFPLSGEAGNVQMAGEDMEDRLVSIVLALAPRAITLHVQEEGEAFPILRKIFGTRLHICEGCSMCQNQGHR